MSRVVEVPERFDDRTFDQLARSLGEPTDEKLLFDAHYTHWASPLGLLALLTAGQWLKEHEYPQPQFTLPEDRRVAHYWARMGFFEFGQEYFELHGRVPRAATGPTDQLLNITPIRGTEDVHRVVGHVQERSRAILADVGLESNAILGFTMALSEACQNIVEHAGTGGWVAVQAYGWKRTLNRRVVMIAVSDGGMGFRKSLQSSQADRWGDRWGDASALQAAVFEGNSRYPDPGRGQGLAGMRRYVERWNGKLSVRSGTAKLSIVPSWDTDDPIEDNLPSFPGAQVLIIIPGTKKADEK